MALTSFSSISAAAATEPVYSDFPITLKDYQGDKKSSVSYGGQIARHLLHNALKKLSAKGNGAANPELLALMQQYYSATDAGRPILNPVSKDGFSIAERKIDQLSKDKT